MPIDLNKLEITQAEDCNIGIDGVDLSQIDPDNTCDDCDGEITIGEHRAAGVCSDCFFNDYTDWE